MRILKDFSEVLLFLLLTFFLYFLFILNIPIFRDPHGQLVMNDLSDLTRSSLILELLFGSAVACVLLGTLMMSFVPLLTAGMTAHLWAATYLFIWIDSLTTLFLQTKSLHFMGALGIGVVFIYLFFSILGYFGFPDPTPPAPPSTPGPWKMQMIEYWLWGWMCFYFGISGFLVFNSVYYFGFHIPLAFGALFVCFLNYLLYLFLRKAQGKDIGRVSQYGRILFGVWFLGLIAIWISLRWNN